MRTSLRTQLSVSFGLLMLLLSVALSFGLSASYLRVALADRGDGLHTLASNTATMLAEGLYERMREVELLAAAPPRDAGGQVDTDVWGIVLERVQETKPQYSWIGVADPTGKVLTSTGGLLVGKDVSQRPWFQSAQSTPFTGDVHAAKLLAALLPPSVSGEPLRFLDFAAPVLDPSGKLQAVLGTHATWDWAHEVVSSLRSASDRERGVQVFILDRGGQIIYRPFSIPASIKPEKLSALPLQGGRDLLWTDEAHYLTASAKLPARNERTNLGWTVITRQPLESAMLATHETRVRFLVLGVFAGILAVMQALWLARRFTRPLRAIARAARNIETGNLEVEIPAIRTSTEIQHLSHALRAMKGALVEREAALARANVDLEQRVRERTAELGRAQEKLQQTNEVLTMLVQRDPLTGIHNRRAADERLSLELERHRRKHKPLSVMMIDVDHFKSVNDTLGHQAGDEVLKRLAIRLSELCRETDFVARLGGEEFLVILPDTPPDGALLVAEKLRGGVAADTGFPKRVTISLGLTSPAEAWADETAILAAADEALYAAKLGGRNRVELRGIPAAAQRTA